MRRMLLIHQALEREAYPNCRKMSEELEVSSKTVQRDFDFMRDQMGLPIEWDALKCGFRYTRPLPSGLAPFLTAIEVGPVVTLPKERAEELLQVLGDLYAICLHHRADLQPTERATVDRAGRLLATEARESAVQNGLPRRRAKAKTAGTDGKSPASRAGHPRVSGPSVRSERLA